MKQFRYISSVLALLAVMVVAAAGVGRTDETQPASGQTATHLLVNVTTSTGAMKNVTTVLKNLSGVTPLGTHSISPAKN